MRQFLPAHVVWWPLLLSQVLGTIHPSHHHAFFLVITFFIVVVVVIIFIIIIIIVIIMLWWSKESHFWRIPLSRSSNLVGCFHGGLTTSAIFFQKCTDPRYCRCQELWPFKDTFRDSLTFFRHEFYGQLMSWFMAIIRPKNSFELEVIIQGHQTVKKMRGFPSPKRAPLPKITEVYPRHR